MNDQTQTLLRFILKYGGGFLTAKGLADENTVEVVISGMMAAIGLVWGIMHRKSSEPPSGPSKGISTPLMLLLAALSMLGPLGCSVVRVNTVRPSGDSTYVTCYIPAWPWQDSTRSIERLTVTARTNSAVISLKGLDDAETTSTNAASMVQNIAGTVVGAAIKAATAK